MLRFVVAARRHLRVRPLQLAPVPNHLTSVLTHGPPLCKDFRRHYSSSESAPYQVPSVIRPESSLVWQKTVNPALLTYLKLKKDLLIPIKFTVPENDSNWPEETWGYPLGKHAERLRLCWRKGNQLPDFAVQDLLEMNFAFDFSQYKWDHSIMPALRRYYEVYGHSDVPRHFHIKPGDSKWHETLWGLNLGYRVNDIRNRGDFKAHVEKDREALMRINFCLESTIADRDWDTLVLPSLRVYWLEFGHCDVPQSFEVPDCPPWPKVSAGLRLGYIVKNMRRKKTYAKQSARDADVLKTLDFVWDHFWTNWNDRIFPALQTFKLEKRHNNIPVAFVMPCTMPWPEDRTNFKSETLQQHPPPLRLF
ncbi:hypothetical protein V7S43_014235 [Phytophthora oleae]|uniref:Helicase-associated domain-containing protein n=1 Tax=Phytophthora oleae TaxID=2107226 RepID=A0ABD3F289_9STRA